MMADCRIGYLIVGAVEGKSRAGEHVVNKKGDFLRTVLTR